MIRNLPAPSIRSKQRVIGLLKGAAEPLKPLLRSASCGVDIEPNQFSLFDDVPIIGCCSIGSLQVFSRGGLCSGIRLFIEDWFIRIGFGDRGVLAMPAGYSRFGTLIKLEPVILLVLKSLCLWEKERQTGWQKDNKAYLYEKRRERCPEGGSCRWWLSRRTQLFGLCCQKSKLMFSRGDWWCCWRQQLVFVIVLSAVMSGVLEADSRWFLRASTGLSFSTVFDVHTRITHNC